MPRIWASACESAANFRDVGGETFAQRPTVESGDRGPLADRICEELTDEMRQGEAPLACDGLEPARQCAGEPHRQVSVLTGRCFGRVVDGLARRFFEPGSPSAWTPLASTVALDCVRDGDREIYGKGPIRVDRVGAADQRGKVDEDPFEVGSGEDDTVFGEPIDVSNPRVTLRHEVA